MVERLLQAADAHAPPPPLRTCGEEAIHRRRQAAGAVATHMLIYQLYIDLDL